MKLMVKCNSRKLINKIKIRTKNNKKINKNNKKINKKINKNNKNNMIAVHNKTIRIKKIQK